MIYLDYAATTPMLPEVTEAMTPFLKDEYGNPNAKYYGLAERAKNAVENAREQVAELIGVLNSEVIFTSGATESNNMLIKGIAFKTPPAHIITTSIEHSSVKEVMQFLEQLGWDITYLDPDTKGLISPETLKQEIRKDTQLISVGWVNSEIGTIQDVSSLSEIAAQHDIPFHTDATQAIGKFPLNLELYDKINFLSFSSHKIYGPKGVGAAVIRNDLDGLKPKLVPLIHGGNQENGYRGGTLAVPNIVGFGKACELLSQNYQQFLQQLRTIDEYFISRLKHRASEHISITNASFFRVPGIINVRFPGLNNQLLLKKTSHLLAASTGSACSNTKPSEVLQAIGLPLKHVSESIRFSLSHKTTKAEISWLIEQLV